MTEYYPPPQFIILNVAPAVRSFRRRLANIQDLDSTPTDIIDNILECISDHTCAYGNLLKYLVDTKERHKTRLLTYTLNELVLAIRELGLALIAKLEELKAYAPDEKLWYQLYGFCVDDIIIANLGYGDGW